MLNLSDLKIGTKIIVGNDPYIVIFSQHSKIGRGGAIVRSKLKNLLTGATIAKTFQGAEKIEEAELRKKSAQFLYADTENAHFMDNENFEQFELKKPLIAEQLNFLSENSPVEILYFREQPINIELPIKMTFEIISTPPGVKGNSAGSVTKLATISTGKQVAVPLFIKEGDKILIDTRTGNYIERTN